MREGTEHLLVDWMSKNREMELSNYWWIRSNTSEQGQANRSQADPRNDFCQPVDFNKFVDQ